MGVRERLRFRLPIVRRRKSAATIWSNFPRGWTVVTGPGNFSQLSADFYEKNALIYACVEELATSAAEPQLIVETKRAKGWEQVEDHALGELLANPNPYLTGYQFWHSVMMFQAIAGNMYFEKERSGSGRVVALWPIRPDRINPETGGQGRRRQLVAWRVSFSEGHVEDMPPEDIIQFKTSHPRSDLVGMSPLGVCVRMAGVDNNLTDYLSAFFRNAAVPYGLLFTKHAIDEAETQRIRAKFREQFSGEEGWHSLMILDELLAAYQQVGALPKDVEMVAGREIGESRICMVFQVPPILVGARVGLEHATYSNYGEARKSFMLETMMPHFRRHADVINLQLAPEFGDLLRVRWDYTGIQALQEEANSLHGRVRDDVQAGYVTVNEGRQALGLDPVVDGDVFLRPMNIIAAPAAVAGQKMIMAGSYLGQLAGMDRATALAPMASHLLTVGGLKQIWAKALDRTAESWEGPFATAARARFAEDQERILKILRREGKKSKEALPFQIFGHTVQEYLEQEARDSWRDVFVPLFRGVVDAQGVNIAAAWGIEFDVDAPEVQAFLRDYTMKFSERMFEVDAGAMNKIISEAQDQGWSVPQIRDAILAKWEQNDRVRADAIARTETIRSSNAGAKEAMRLAGIRVIRWLDTDDTRTCPFCRELGRDGGRAIDITGTFFKLGDEFVVVDSEGVQHSMKIDYADVGYPPLHVKCLLPGTKVIAPQAQMALRMPYEGDIVELRFADGTRLTVTPNHQILTPAGLVPAKSLRQGSDVIYCPTFERIVPGYPNNDRQPVIVEEIFDTFAKAPGMLLGRVPVAPEYLHGDARFGKGDIDVITANGFLKNTMKAAFPERFGEPQFDASNANAFPFSGQGDLVAMLVALGYATRGSVSGLSIAPMLVGSSSAIHQSVGLGGASYADAIFQEPPDYDLPADPEALRQCLLRFAGLVSTQKVIDIKFYPFSGHVYDLQTFSTLYISNGVVSSNCRCTIIAVFEEV